MEQPRLEKRERIMTAALRLFVEPGYFNTTVPDLAAAAGVSVGTIYHYFKSKEDLAAALFVLHIERYRERMLSALQGQPALEPRIKTTVRETLTFIEREPEVARFLFFARHDEFIRMDNPHLGPVDRDELNKYMHRFLRQGMRDGLLRKIPMQAAIATLMGIPFRYGQLWLEGAYKARPAQMGETLAQCAWDALRSGADFAA